MGFAQLTCRAKRTPGKTWLAAGPRRLAAKSLNRTITCEVQQKCRRGWSEKGFTCGLHRQTYCAGAKTCRSWS